MISAQAEEGAGGAYAPVSALHDFGEGQGGEVAVHALFEFLCVAWYGGVDVG